MYKLSFWKFILATVEDLETFIDYYFDMTTKPDPKRGRSELSSGSESEMAGGLTPGDRAMLEAMHEQIKQLKKLDLLHEMIQDIGDLKTSVDFTNKLIEDLKKENAALRSTVDSLQTETTRLTSENKQLKAEMLDLQCRSMRNNVVIWGIKEEEKEDYIVTENLVKEFMKNGLQMSEEQVGKAEIERAHRLGRIKEEGKSRAIVVNFQNYIAKRNVMGRGMKLKGSHYSMFDQFPREIVERRRVLYPIMKEHKEKKIKVRLNMDKLYINDQLYRDSKITTWL